ncbi:RIP metalloprotease RseP [Altericista sp. CCNU0014]|uniref:RIP metalloprotease RseP n=1 Tax=Altericista sp. CCNU0014 TaxID=3082949 RepID=UPI00384AC79E
MSVLLAIAVLALLIVVHESGHFLAARAQGIYVTRFSIGFGPVLWKYQGAQTEYALRAIPLGGYVAFPDDDEGDSGISSDDPSLMKNRPILDRAIVISAGVIANLIFAYFLIFAQLGWQGIPNPQIAPGIAIVQLVPDASAAAQAGILPGDIVLALNGQTLGTGESAVQSFQDRVKSSAGQPLTLDVRREGKALELSVTPQLSPENEPLIGVRLSPNASLNRIKTLSPVKLLNAASTEFQNLLLLTVGGFGQLLSNFQNAAGQVSGPVAIVKIGADIARTDISRLLQFGALISINLAVINSLPLPALDGGQLVFLLFEGIFRKPLPSAIQQGVMQTGLFFLLGLGVLLIARDTVNLF